MCRMDETELVPKIPFPVSSQLWQVPDLGRVAGKQQPILFLCSAGWCKPLELMYIVTYLLAHLVGMGQLSVLKFPCLPSGPHAASLCPGLAVCLPHDEGHQLLQQDIYTIKAKGNKEETQVLDHPHGLQLMLLGSLLS